MVTDGSRCSDPPNGVRAFSLHHATAALFFFFESSFKNVAAWIKTQLISCLKPIPKRLEGVKHR